MTGYESHYSLDELAQLGDGIMQKTVSPKLSAEDDGKFVAIDVLTGEYEVDEDDYIAVTRLRARQPAADIWLACAGFPTTCRL